MTEWDFEPRSSSPTFSAVASMPHWYSVCGGPFFRKVWVVIKRGREFLHNTYMPSILVGAETSLNLLLMQSKKILLIVNAKDHWCDLPSVSLIGRKFAVFLRLLPVTGHVALSFSPPLCSAPGTLTRVHIWQVSSLSLFPKVWKSVLLVFSKTCCHKKWRTPFPELAVAFWVSC